MKLSKLPSVVVVTEAFKRFFIVLKLEEVSFKDKKIQI
jgi:hypothetical protein